MTAGSVSGCGSSRRSYGCNRGRRNMRCDRGGGMLTLRLRNRGRGQCCQDYGDERQLHRNLPPALESVLPYQTHGNKEELLKSDGGASETACAVYGH